MPIRKPQKRGKRASSSRSPKSVKPQEVTERHGTPGNSNKINAGRRPRGDPRGDCPRRFPLTTGDTSGRLAAGDEVVDLTLFTVAPTISYTATAARLQPGVFA